MIPFNSTMPYGYGTGNDIPMPMAPQPMGQNMMPGQSFAQQPQQMNQNQNMPSQPKYASGGHVRGMAERLRNAGQRGDKVLAHINPMEARELEMNHGMDINPHTGLPQYGLYDSLSSGLGNLYDYGRNGLNSMGDYVEGLGQDIWRDYGHGAVDSGLGYLDSAVSGALPALGTAGGAIAGAPFGSPAMGAGAGGMFGQSLADKYNQSGGLRGYLMPKLSGYFGQGNPSGANMSRAGNFMHGLQGAMGNGVNSGIGYLDRSISGSLPGLGASAMNAAGIGGGAGNMLGQKLSSAYSQAGGLPGMIGQARNYFNPAQSQMPAQAPSMAPQAPMQSAQQPAAPQYATRASMLGMNDAMGNPVQQMRQPQMATRASMLGQSNPYQFADGGRVDMEGMAQHIKGYGEEGDDILAHINPQEAMELNHKYGSDVNPETGLPQFGKFLKSLHKIVNPAYALSQMSKHDRQQKKDFKEAAKNNTLEAQMARNPVPQGPNYYPRPLPNFNRKIRQFEPDFLGPEEDYFEDEYENEMPQFAQGGYLGGYTDGKQDKIDAQLSDGEYVLDAPFVAFMGGGNNNAGAKKLDEIRRMAGVGDKFTPTRQKKVMKKMASGGY